MELNNIKAGLRNASLDIKAGIKLIKLTGDRHTSVYAAEIPPKTSLNPHFHKNGIEIYQILEGNGIMRVGEMKNGTLTWNENLHVQMGDFLSIHEQEIHQIENDSDNSLIAIFTCPESHLGDDRYFVKKTED